MKYYYIDDTSKQQYGPFTLQGLATKEINKDTLVWCAGMKDWMKAGHVPELAFIFNKNVQIPSPTSNNPYQQSNKTPTYNYQQNQRQQSNPYNNYKWDGILPLPKTWLLESILLTIFCCSPISLVGIFYANKVESLYYAKDFDASVKASRRARNWALFGMLFLPGCYALLFLFGIFIGLITELSNI